MLLYDASIRAYTGVIGIAALFNPKAALWVKGRKNIWQELANSCKGHANIVWFHCASLGEFEQGRPVIEAFRSDFPEHKILLTFFSPSGYEVRKNYSGVDFVFYLPADTIANAKHFMQIVNPVLAVFVKYEFWFNYLKVLKFNKIPVLVISSVFRPQQHFFKWYGSFFRKGLQHISWFFVQNMKSQLLLQSIGINNVTVSGDTRFDRVAAIARNPVIYSEVENFCGKSDVIICGSTWPADDEIIWKLIDQSPANAKFIIAPHEVHQARIAGLLQKSKGKAVLFSDLKNETAETKNILIINNIGILSHLYKYGRIAYIGGGFGAGTHNILEAATFGLPVFFGPNHLQFTETVELIRAGGAFGISNAQEFVTQISGLLSNSGYYNKCSTICSNYIAEKQGATKLIMLKIKSILIRS
jgi:3-deoxy-D-manno-octulosonic-acid transferase